MNNDKIYEILNNYSEDLNNLLSSLREERTTLQMEDDSRRKEKKLALIDEKISKVEQLAHRLDCLYGYDEIMGQLDSLRDSKEIPDEVVSSISVSIDTIMKNVAQLNNLKEDELNNSDEIIRQINRKTVDLRRSERLLSGQESKEIHSKLEELENKLAALKKYDVACKQTDKLTELIDEVLASSNEKDKNKAIDQCIDYINSIVDDDLDQIIKNDVSEVKKLTKKQDKKKEVKKEKEEKDKKFAMWFKKHWKKITAGVVAVAALATISVLINKGIEKMADKMDKENDDTTTQSQDTTENIDTIDTTIDRSDILDKIEKVEDPVILALKEKGYNEYNAKLMTENFDDETLKALLEFYRPEAEKYAGSKEFNLDYLDNYEQTIAKYEVSSDQAIDYVNRAYKVKETGFFNNDEELDITYIIDTIKSIDKKETMIATDSLLCDALNRIAEGYLFGNSNENDLKKLDSFKYLAKEGTDLNAFLVRFESLIKNIINEPKSNIRKNELYNFLNIFGHSVNGISDNDAHLTNDESLNKDAIISDYYDYWIAYNYFIQPLYPLAYPTEIELPPTTPIIPEGATEEMINEAWADLQAEWDRIEKEKGILDIESRMYELEELQIYIYTTLCGPEYDNFNRANEGLIK